MSYNNRNEIPAKYIWNLSDIFVTPADWDKTYDEYCKNMSKLGQFKGKLNNAEEILAMFEYVDEQTITLERLHSYAYMTYCEDSKDAEKQSRFGKVSMLVSKYSEEMSYVEPELSELSEEELNGFINDPKFIDYNVQLKKIRDSKAHILSEKEEKLLAGATDFSRYFQEVFNRLDSGDLDFGEITVDGQKVKLSHGAYSMYLQNPDQNVRRDAFKTYYKAYTSHINTLAGLYEGNVKQDIYFSKVRNFGSAIEKALFYEDVDKKVYENLISSINNSFAPLHEYIALRKKLLKVETLNMYDLYVPIFENADIAVDYEEAFNMVIEGLAPLGDDYKKLLERARDEHWIDVHETPTKRSGAYSLSVYGVHPYMMLNYQKTTHDVFTLAHELGHSMHSFYSEKAQKHSKADYTIFVAEVASTCNEVLLLNYLLKKVTDVNVKKYLLSYYLDMLRTTMYRQAMFAEFEYIAHEKAEKGEPLSSKLLSDEYYALNKKYYGAAVEHNEEIAYEWSRIPHFYRDFYVYKYSTGITSAVCIAQKILAEGEPAVAKYKKFLSLGGSTDPVSELKVAGVDLMTSEPFEIVAKSFTDTLNELKELCK